MRADLSDFRDAVRAHRRAVGRTQQQLARAVGLHPHVLSHKLNGTGTPLRERDVVAIVTTLAEWGAIADADDVLHLLDLVELPISIIPDSAWRAGPLVRFAPADRRAARRINPPPVPAPINSFVGRVADLTQVRSALAESRLVSLVGVGGTGKTRLAIEVAGRVADRFSDGTAFVDLAATHDTAVTAAAIARTLGVSPSSVSAAEVQLAEVIRELELLIVVDNVEQLRGAGRILARLLETAPRVRLLVTSRVPLRVAGEHIVRVPPLTVPPPGATAAEITASDAVQLFLQRVRAAGVVLDEPEDLAAAAEICAAVDGLPLAIELAAGRVPMIPPRQLVELLNCRLDVLTGGTGDRPTRQQTLRATLDWSYALLDPPTARFFAQLGVCASHFDAAAAAALNEPALTGEQSQALLAELAEHSLLTVHRGDPPTYRMMQTVREYALAQLAAAGGLGETRRRHLAHWGSRTPRLRAELAGALDPADYVAKLTALEQRYPDILAALEFAIDAGRTDPEVLAGGLQLAVDAVACWVRGPGPAGEGMRLLDQLIRLPSVAALPAAERAAAMVSVALFACFTGDYRRAEQLSRAVLSAGPEVGDMIAAYALRFLGEARLWLGDAVDAERQLRAALAAARRSGDDTALANGTNVLAEALRVQGRLGAAERTALEAVRSAHGCGDPLLVSHCLHTLADCLRDRCDYARARRLLRFTLRRHARLFALRALAADLESLAATLSLEGVGADVFTLVAAGRRLRDAVAMPLPPPTERQLWTALRPAVDATDALTRARAEARGWNAPVEDTVRLALWLARDPARVSV
jgi:non-specific serine/threonine protein kinase